MISLNLSSVKEKQIESERLAAAMRDFWKRPGGSFQVVESFQSKPRPERRNWVDPETVLKRKTRNISPAGRKQLRKMADAL
jgi:hypothetical protein